MQIVLVLHSYCYLLSYLTNSLPLYENSFETIHSSVVRLGNLLQSFLNMLTFQVSWWMSWKRPNRGHLGRRCICLLQQLACHSGSRCISCPDELLGWQAGIRLVVPTPFLWTPAISWLMVLGMQIPVLGIPTIWQAFLHAQREGRSHPMVVLAGPRC